MPSNREKQVLTELLKAVREDAGLRQEDLAARLGRPQSFVSKYESGERRVEVLELRDICTACGISLPEFVNQLENQLRQD